MSVLQRSTRNPKTNSKPLLISVAIDHQCICMQLLPNVYCSEGIHVPVWDCGVSSVTETSGMWDPNVDFQDFFIKILFSSLIFVFFIKGKHVFVNPVPEPPDPTSKGLRRERLSKTQDLTTIFQLTMTDLLLHAVLHSKKPTICLGSN